MRLVLDHVDQGLFTVDRDALVSSERSAVCSTWFGENNIGDTLAVFEPTHGSAPKYAGMYKVNPIATILSAKLMLDWLGEKEMGARVEAATADVIKEGKVRTYDMGGSSRTLEMAEAIAARL